VSDLGSIYDRSIRAFSVKPRAFGAPLKRLRGLTAQHDRANCRPCRDAHSTVGCILLRAMFDRWSAGFLN